MYLLKQNFILGSINKKILSNEQFAVEGVGVRGVLKTFLSVFLWFDFIFYSFFIPTQPEVSGDLESSSHNSLQKNITK